MEENKVTTVEFKKEAAKRKVKNFFDGVKQAAKGAYDAAAQTAKENPEAVVAGLTVVGSVMAKEIFASQKRHAARKEKEDDARYMWDPSEGHRWYLKKIPTTAQYLEIGRRRDAGEKLKDILVDMKLL